MNKTIAILIFTFFLGCNAFAQASQSVPPPDTVAPVVTITQQQFDSLVTAAARSNQMQEIAQQEAEQMFDIYTTHVSWVIGLFGVLVALFGAALPYLINRNYEKRIEKKIADHDEEIKQSRQSLSDQSRKNEQLMSELEGVKNHVDQVESSIKKMQEKMKQSEEQARQSAITAKASALFSKALKEKDTDIKISLYTEVLDLDPQSAEAHNNRGAAYSEKGEYDNAIRDYDEAIKLNPQFAEAYYNRGNAFFNKGEYDKAIQDYCEVIKLNPQFADAYYNRGAAYSKKKEYDRAIQDYDEAIKLNPLHARAYNNRGFAYMRRGKEGDYALAKADFEKGLTLNPDEETRQKLQENLHKLEDWMKEKADKASAQQP